MSCEKYHKKILFEYLENNLSEEENKNISKHIEICPECRRTVEVYNKLTKTVSETKESLPSDFKINFREKDSSSNVISFLKRHQRAVASAVAVIALIIFSNGIGKEVLNPPDLNQKISSEFSAGNARTAPAVELNTEHILNYNLPDKNEFKSENEYEEICEELDKIKERAKDANPEQIGDVLIEFDTILLRIEKAKK